MMQTSPPLAEQISANIALVRDHIAAAARRAGREPDAVTLIAVSKTHSPAVLAAAVAAGMRDFGENRVQEAAEKAPAVEAPGPLVWHLIGHLQRNKARRAVEIFDMIHSVDRVRLAEELDRYASEAGRSPLPVLLQVNVAGEEQKEGFDLPGGLASGMKLTLFYAEVERIMSLSHLEVRGLMAIAPYVADPEQARPTFHALRELRDNLALRFGPAAWRDLSMGMTGDYEVAVEEGATLVRVGRAIFGDRI